MSEPPLLLYSASTWLAYAVAERYCGGVHYAWCSPCWDGATAALHVNIPPSSSPAEIYRMLLQDTRRGDTHSGLIQAKRKGIRTGADARYEAGVISDHRRREVIRTVTSAALGDFRPVLFVIPFAAVAERVMEVPLEERAHPLSIEYRVEELPRACFDVIELRV